MENGSVATEKQDEAKDLVKAVKALESGIAVVSTAESIELMAECMRELGEEAGADHHFAVAYTLDLYAAALRRYAALIDEADVIASCLDYSLAGIPLEVVR